MDAGAESLMTVHLLTHLGHSSLLQRTLDRLLEWLCLDTRLFLVSERATPLKLCERHRRRSRSFPGISVLLFLHEALGEERIFQVHEQFQRPPWRYQRAQFAIGQSPHCAPSHQDFYGLDEQLPVWGVRRVRGGPEALRVTLHCSFENYEDAVRLYELILQREAALQQSTACVFVLHASPHVAVQLCLEQLPAGVAAQPRDAAALQFRVQELGQLVPLLPNPCVPISSTRWQTQDYEGNTILLKVQNSSKTLETNIGLSQQHNNTGKIPLDCVPAPFPVKEGNPGRRSQEDRAVKGRTKCERSEALAPEQASGALPGPPRPAPGAPAARPRPPLPGSRPARGAETDVDTGLAVGNPVGNPGSGRCPPSLCSRAPRSSLLQLPLPAAGGARRCPEPGGARGRPRLPPPAAPGRRGAGHGASGCPAQTAPLAASPAHRAEEEEEFFI